MRHLLCFILQRNLYIMKKGSIAIFDSGVGGLSLYKELKSVMPNEHYIYLADLDFAPYGDKIEADIIERCFAILNFFSSLNVKSVLIACNTATTLSIQLLKPFYSFPIIGVTPQIYQALSVTQTKKIAVLATTRTIRSKKLNTQVDALPKNFSIYLRNCPGLANSIDCFHSHPDIVESYIKKYTSDFLEKSIDTVVLGCTHYNLVSNLIINAVNYPITVVNNSTVTALEMKALLKDKHQLTSNTPPQNDIFFTTGSNINDFEKSIDFLLQKKIKAEAVFIDMSVASYPFRAQSFAG